LPGVAFEKVDDTPEKADDSHQSHGTFYLSIQTAEELLTSFVKEQDRISVQEAQEILGVGKSRASKILQIMCQKGILERRGAARSTHYVLREKSDE